MLQILLGFGMVIVLLEQVLADTKTVHERLKRAHEKLEELAHVDPLTTALNRHAFHGYLKRFGDDGQAVFGCVGFFDIDDLKLVNDAHGHDTGDKVIRAVVRAIRGIIRAEDLIFRWGGDEFFVIMIGMEAEMGTIRMNRLESMLSSIKLEGVERPLAIGVSYAFEEFTALAELETTIKRADAGMYRQKQIRKGLLDDDRFDIGTAVLAGEAMLID
jgi:diguanylate cyclase (GGDEF)-like protein